jgi:hypothetical protein
MQQTLMLLVLAIAAAAAQAEPVYRSHMPDGRVVYGDKPAPGATESRLVDQSKQNIVEPVRSAPAAQKKRDSGGARAGEDRVASAQKALDAAKAALEAGREVGEGDRLGVAKKGASRLSDEYYERVKRLEDEVAAAQKELDDARAAR